MKQGMQKQTIFFTTILLSIFAYSAFQIFHLKQSRINFSSTAPIFNSLDSMEDLTRNYGLKKLKRMINNGNIKQSLLLIKGLQKKIVSISNVTGFEPSDIVKSLNSTRLKLIAISNQNKPKYVYNDLSAKTKSFKKFAVQNRWRTLTRISNVIEAKLNISKNFNKLDFTQKRLKTNIKEIRQLFSTVKKVTRGSILSSQNKKRIIAQIKFMEVDLNQLRKYSLSIKELNFRKLSRFYLSWFNSSIQNLKKSKAQFENFGENVSNVLYVISISLLGLVLLGLFFNKYYSKKSIQFMEFKILKILDSVITGKNNSNIFGDLSLESKKKISKYEIYMQKRINLGDQLKDGIPFPSALFDSNLNLLWANDLFYSSFQLEKNDYIQDDLNWSGLRNRTNLGENDPLLSALGDDVAGIYQIQLQDDQHPIPYEMYVTPIVHNSSRNIHLILYPLSEIEDTLDNQMKTLVSPIIKSIDAISCEKFDKNFSEKIRHEFDVAGISDIYLKLSGLSDNFVQQKHGFLTEVERLENKVIDQIKCINDIKGIMSSVENFNRLVKENFKMVKDQVISVIDLRFEEEDLWNDFYKESKKIVQFSDTILAQYKTLFLETKEVRDTVQVLCPIKNNIRELKNQLEEIKAEMFRSLDQQNVQNRITQVADSKFSVDFKESLNNFNLVMDYISKTLTQLDVGISKMDLLTKNVDSFDFNNNDNYNNDYLARVEGLNLEFQKEVENGARFDTKIVGSIKDTYQNILEENKQFKDFNLLVKEDDTFQIQQDNIEISSSLV